MVEKYEVQKHAYHQEMISEHKLYELRSFLEKAREKKYVIEGVTWKD